MPIIAKNLPDKNDNLYVAISGGIDSLAAAYYLLKKGFKFKLFHFNHGINPYHNDRMQRTVEKFAEDYELELFVGSPDKSFKVQEGKSIEAELRGERVKAYNNLDGNIIICHHLGDVKESLIMRLLEGNPDYLPIPAETKLKNGFKLIRPFLLTEKDDFIKFVFNNNIGEYLYEDVSNSDTKYTRNWIRHQVLPMMESRVCLDNAAKKAAKKAYEKVTTNQ